MILIRVLISWGVGNCIDCLINLKRGINYFCLFNCSLLIIYLFAIKVVPKKINQFLQISQVPGNSKSNNKLFHSSKFYSLKHLLQLCLLIFEIPSFLIQFHDVGICHASCVVLWIHFTKT